MKYTFTKATDEEHKIKVDSNLLYAMWKSGCARGGAEAKFEIRTSFVGQGAKIEVVVKGSDYGKIEKISGTIYNNRYSGIVTIPKDVEPGENVWFEVKLTKQKLKGTSNNIPAYPQPEMTKMQWNKKEARRGDIVKLQAEFERVAEKTEAFVTVFEHDQDGSHDKIVTIPATIINRKIDLQWEYEYHEDVDEIPTDEEMNKYGKSYNPPEYFFVVDIDGAKFGEEQESGLLQFKDSIEISLIDEDNSPVADTMYDLELSDGSKKQGTLDSNGKATEDSIPPGKLKVTFQDIERFECINGDNSQRETIKGEIAGPSGNSFNFKIPPFIFSE